MTDTRRNETSVIYEIRVQGIIGPQWSLWFDNLRIVPLEAGDTVLTGPVVDQAALHSILDRIYSLNLPLVSIKRIDALRPDYLPSSGQKGCSAE